jgi:hypothetical protein
MQKIPQALNAILRSSVKSTGWPRPVQDGSGRCG